MPSKLSDFVDNLSEINNKGCKTCMERKNIKSECHFIILSYTSVPNKPFGSLLEISPTNHIFLKTFNSEYDEIKVWFTDQNSKLLEIEDRINLPMEVKWILGQFPDRTNSRLTFPRRTLPGRTFPRP